MNFQTQSLDKVSRLLYLTVMTFPSELSINHLSKKVGVDKNFVDSLIFLLAKIGTINLVQKGEKLSEKIRKEYKIFLGDTNKYYVYNLEPEIGTIREAFFVSEISKNLQMEISLPTKEDFLVQYKGEKYHFEIGGKSKKSGKYSKDGFIVRDGFEINLEKNNIPLWLVGFLS